MSGRDTAVASRGAARLLVIEDEASIRRGLEVALRGRGYHVCVLADGRTVEEVARRFRPDAAILDVRLGIGMDGYDVARLLRTWSREIAIVFLTAADSLRARLDGFDAGADDYLVKPFSLDELVARLAALLRRGGRVPAVWEVGDLVVDDSTRTVARGGTEIRLTPTEYELLSALARHPGQVLSKAKLVPLVWGYDAHPVTVVDVHLSSLRRKLEVLGPRLVHTVWGVGFVLRAE